MRGRPPRKPRGAQVHHPRQQKRTANERAQLTARPGGSTGTSRARRRVSRGARRVTRGALLLDYRDGLRRAKCHAYRPPFSGPPLTPTKIENIIHTTRGDHRQVAGFKSERVAGIQSECMAGFVGIRNLCHWS
jgi:hypothetical protein